MYIDSQKEKLLILCGLALLEDLIRYSKYPSEIQFEISQEVQKLQTKLTKPPTYPRYDNYGNQHPNVEIASEEQFTHRDDCPYADRYEPEQCYYCRSHR